MLTKDHSAEIIPPVLLPGETLILQQDKVTCINTLCRAATGALHLTNYRIIFTGVYMQVCLHMMKSDAETEFLNLTQFMCVKIIVNTFF